MLVRKKSGAVRPCVDYRGVNALVQNCLDAVVGASLFSSFDLTRGNFQIPLIPEDIPKSTFVCKFGQYEMIRMPFRFTSTNSVGAFQRTTELALRSL